MSESEALDPLLEVQVSAAAYGRDIRLTGELDSAEAGGLQGLLDDARRGERVDVDASGLTFVDSTGLRLIVDWHRRLGELDGTLVIRAPSTAMVRVLAATQLDGVLCIDPSADGSA